MALIRPAYIVQTLPGLHYSWNDRDFELAEKPVDAELLAALSTISMRGNLALLAASAEWLVHLLLPLIDDDPLPLDAVEALWAQVVDWRYAAPWDPFDENEYTGSIRGPIRRMAMWMREGPRCMSDGLGNGVRHCAAAATVLALHVQPSPAFMRVWLSFALARLQALSPANDKDSLGAVVPRQALDPTIAFNPEETGTLIDQFLQTLNYQEGPNGNGFLMLPGEMLFEGFAGTPYRFEA